MFALTWIPDVPFFVNLPDLQQIVPQRVLAFFHQMQFIVTYTMSVHTFHATIFITEPTHTTRSHCQMPHQMV